MSAERELDLQEVLDHLSPNGRLEWELAVERAKNARLLAELAEHEKKQEDAQ